MPRRHGGGRRLQDKSYGVLRARPVAFREEHSQESPHFQILAVADGVSWRVAVNVRSQVRGGSEQDSVLLYRVIDGFTHPVLDIVRDFKEGFTTLRPDAESGALDFVRGNLFDPKSMKLLPPDLPGGHGLNDLLAGYVQTAVNEAAELFAFGIAWGPEPRMPDKIFGFRPGRGVHDIHMNQGNPKGFHDQDNGVWHDGGLLIRAPSAERWSGIFLAFQSQAWHTDDRTGNALDGETGSEPRRFDERFQPLAPDAQVHSRIEIAGLRYGKGRRIRPAALLMNATDQDMDLSGWTLAARKDKRHALNGILPAGETLTIELPRDFLNPRGGFVSLLDAAGLKATGVSYRSDLRARTGWSRT